MRKLINVFVSGLALLVAMQAAAAAADGYSETEQANMETVSAMYAAFGAGDMDALLATMSDDIVWEINGSSEVDALHGSRSGKDAVQAWFAELDSMVETTDFGVDNMWADGEVVFVLCHDSGIVRSTGITVSQRELMIFWLEDGKVARMLDFDDSAQEYMAMHPMGGDDGTTGGE